MNEDNQTRECLKCGAKLTTTGYCLRCGYDNSNSEIDNAASQVNSTPQYSNDNVMNNESTQISVSKQVQVETNKEDTMTEIEKEIAEQQRKRNIKSVIFSLLNVLFIAGPVANFAGVWVLFGALSGDKFKYSFVTIACLVYVIISYIIFLFSVINLFTKDKLNKILKVLAIILIGFHLFGPSISKKIEKKKYVNNLSKVKIEEKYVFENEKQKVKQKDITFDGTYAKVRFSVEQKDGKEYNCNNSNPKYRVNGFYLTALSDLYTKSNIAKDEATGDCVLSISYNDLKKYNIKEIYSIDIWINRYIVNIKTDSSKTSNKGDIKAIENEKNLLHENEYFKMYYDPQDTNYIQVYFVSKIKEDYTLDLRKEDFDTPGLLNDVGYYGISLYDYTITKITYSLKECQDNMKYLKAVYEIYTNGIDKIEGTIDEKYPDYKYKNKCKN